MRRSEERRARGPAKAAERLRGEQGTSLVEMLIAITLLFILLMGVLFMFEFGLRNAKGIQTQSIVNVEATNVMEKMVRQIRCAKRFLVPTVVAPMTGNPLYFVADVDGSGTDSEITFYRTSGNVLTVRQKKGAAAASDREVAQNVTALTFELFDSGGTSLGAAITEGNRTSVNRVDITLSMQKNTGTGSTPITVTKRATVDIRCLLTLEDMLPGGGDV